MDELDNLLQSLKSTQTAEEPQDDSYEEKRVKNDVSSNVAPSSSVQVPSLAPSSATGQDMAKAGVPATATAAAAVPKPRTQTTTRAWAQGFNLRERNTGTQVPQALLQRSAATFKQEVSSEDERAAREVARMDIRHIPGTGAQNFIVPQQEKPSRQVYITKADGTKVLANSVFSHSPGSGRATTDELTTSVPQSTSDDDPKETESAKSQEATKNAEVEAESKEGELDDLNAFRNLRQARKQEVAHNNNNSEPPRPCDACKRPIYGHVITSGDKKLHIDCFVCSAPSCKRSLAGTQYFFAPEGLFCDSCYHETFSPRCAYCEKPIKERQISALGKTFHPEHFFCSQCGKVFGPDEQFLESGGQAYCEEDFGVMFAGVCQKCQKPLLGDFVATPTNKWHKDCFDCVECHVPLMANGFFEHEGRPYCEEHYVGATSKICVACSKSVIGRFVRAGGLQYHPSCFRCAFCRVSLDTSTIGVGWGAQRQVAEGGFRVHQGKSYCVTCSLKFYG